MSSDDKKAVLACPECGSRFTDGRAYCSFDGTKLLSGDDDPLIGKRIDQYEILERIGEGGMATVYRVRHVLLEQEYALKMLAGELAANPLVSRRFLREAQAAAKIEHPNVVKVVYSGTTERGLTFLVMELLNGRSLDALIHGQELVSTQSAAEIARQIARGLAEIHRVGFVHRDIKPSNIMLVKNGGGVHVKILDLGVVGVLEPNETNPRVTRADHVVGTPQYMAPEALSGDPYHASADLYALGAVMYEMLSGRPMFNGTVPEILWSQLHAEPDPLPRLDGLEELTHRLLAKEPSRRPKDANTVAHEIEHLLARNKIVGVVEDVPKRARRAISRAFSISLSPRKRNLKWWLVASLAVAIVLGLDALRFIANRASVLPLPIPMPAPAKDPPVLAPGLTPVLTDRALPVAPPPVVAENDQPVEKVVPERRPQRPRPSKISEARATQSDGETIEVMITSDPSGAAVIMSGGQLGLTPLSVPFEKGRPTPLMFRLDGYTDRKVTLRPSDSAPVFNVRLAPRGAK